MLKRLGQPSSGKCTRRNPCSRDVELVGRRPLLWPQAFVEHRAPGEGNQMLTGTRPVSIDYADLKSRNNVSDQIEQAFGPNGLGLIIIRGHPSFPSLRRNLLPLARKFALLPSNIKAKYVDPESNYSYGWSHGKEELSPGVPDTRKGSYYANPLVDDQLRDAKLTEAQKADLRVRNPSYYGKNIWPGADLPELEPALKAAGRAICDVGQSLMDACDSYVADELGIPRGQLSAVLRRSLNPKARLLHYFPPTSFTAEGEQQAWCGWHNDHGSLTGLMPAMYIDASGREMPCPDPRAGLYIRDRHDRVVRVTIPPDCVAFQVGEALQVHSGGLLRATAHYVRAAEGPAAVGVSRNTFAVFMQPDVTEPMDCPPGVSASQVEVGQWKPGHTFGEFAEATFAHYYPKH